MLRRPEPIIERVEHATLALTAMEFSCSTWFTLLLQLRIQRYMQRITAPHLVTKINANHDQRSVACKSLVIPWATACLHAPLQNSIIEECVEYRQRKSTSPDTCCMQKDYTAKRRFMQEQRREIYVHLNVVKCICMGTDFCTALLAGKSEVRLKKNTGALL